jgi:hypothetical protein
VTDFDSAVADFTRFAVSEGYPQALLWVASESVRFWRGRNFVLVRNSEEQRVLAKANFDAAMIRDMGLAIEGRFKTASSTICHLYVPEDDLDAQCRMIPATGVKMLVTENPLPVVLIKNRIVWGILKLISRPWDLRD